MHRQLPVDNLLLGVYNTMRIAIGVVVGAVLGFGYYKVIGCSSGACPITSSPLGSTIYGALIGFMIASMGGSN